MYNYVTMNISVSIIASIMASYVRLPADRFFLFFLDDLEVVLACKASNADFLIEFKLHKVTAGNVSFCCETICTLTVTE